MSRIELRVRGRRSGGFSLAEALLALLLLGGILAAVIAWIVHNRGALVRMEDLVQFHGRGLQVVEAAVREDLKDLVKKSPAELQAWAEDVVRGSGLDQARIQVTLDPVSGQERMRMLTVQVEWKDPLSIGRRVEYRTTMHRLLTSQAGSLTLPVGLTP